MQQCKGTTLKGAQCKIKVDGEYCRYHVKTNVKKTLDFDKEIFAKRPGFIYIYTLTKLINSEPMKVKNLPDSKDNLWVTFEPKLSKYYLLKIGMTTKTVATRIKQWEAQCNHRITSVYPGLLKKRGLLSFFKKMSIKDYLTFRDNGFYTEKSVGVVEKVVHRELRKLYGNGSLYCRGCSGDTVRTRVTPFEKYNIHTEWFLIPKKEIEKVFDIVERCCINGASRGNE